MLIKSINYEFFLFSTFAYIICEDNDIYYTPVYNKKNRVARFEEVLIDDKKTIVTNVYIKYDIKVNDKRVYAYNRHGKIYIGKYWEIKKVLKELLNDGKYWKPFCKLEVIQFLNIKGKQKNKVLNDCYEYLKKISLDYANKWAEEIKYKIPIPAPMPEPMPIPIYHVSQIPADNTDNQTGYIHDTPTRIPNIYNALSYNN